MFDMKPCLLFCVSHSHVCIALSLLLVQVESEAVKIEAEEKECTAFAADAQKDLDAAEPELRAVCLIQTCLFDLEVFHSFCKRMLS
jgi:hypothetical protein